MSFSPLTTSGLGLTRPAAQSVLPAPPRAFLDTSYRPPSGRTLPVAKGDDLQGALKTARPGDLIVLEPGATFQGNFSLPKKVGTGWSFFEPERRMRSCRPAALV
jgi:hypothetical protein